jgi:predicted short-subunit dehydrogenase-like oxidoreductase (DUF2520 family)
MAPASQPFSVAIVGKGRLGTALAKGLKNSKLFSITAHLPGRSASFKQLARSGGPELLLIACKDDAIAATAAAASIGLENLKSIAHFAGSRGPSILPKLAGVSRMTLHPIQTLAVGDPDLFVGASFMLCTRDKAAQEIAKKLVGELGGSQIIELREEQLPLYHAMTVFSSNTLVITGMVIEALTKELGLKETQIKKALTPLMRQTLRNLMSQPATKVLTGPIARGDEETVAVHLKALKSADPAARELYSAFVKFAKAKGLGHTR